jgi:hypothetical protein
MCVIFLYILYSKCYDLLSIQQDVHSLADPWPVFASFLSFTCSRRWEFYGAMNDQICLQVAMPDL